MGHINFIGGEKGGVGKSVVARTLAQYFIDKSISFTAFDTDKSHGALMRFYGEFTTESPVESFESLDQIVETAIEHQDKKVIVDLAAQTDKSIKEWFEESGVTELLEELGLKATFWHVMDDGRDSLQLLEKLVNEVGGKANIVIVKNKGRGENFEQFDRTSVRAHAREFGAEIIEFPKLHSGTMRKIDHHGLSFWAGANINQDQHSLSILERHRVKVWLKRCYQQFAGLTALHTSVPAAEGIDSAH